MEIVHSIRLPHAQALGGLLHDRVFAVAEVDEDSLAAIETRVRHQGSLGRDGALGGIDMVGVVPSMVGVVPSMVVHAIDTATRWGGSG